jgi:defect in organelle trafficking protein DotD
MRFIPIAICIALLAMNGCTSNSERSRLTVISNDTSNREAEAKLAEAATSISASLRQLAEIERATHPQAKLPSPPSAELIGMNQIASVQWSGPVGQLVTTIARKTHYKLRILGRAPAIPILVSISAQDTSLADILRDITFQCGNKANIVTYPASRTIELRYAK